MFRNDKAITYLHKVLDFDPINVEAYSLLGHIHLSEKSFSTALFYFTNIIALESTSPSEYAEACFEIASIFHLQKEHKKAYQLYERLVSENKNTKIAKEYIEVFKKLYPKEIREGSPLNEDDLNVEHYKQSLGKDKNFFIHSKKSSSASSATEKFGRNITELAKNDKLSPVLGREKEINSILETLFSVKKNNALLLGKAGVGKTAIVEGLAQRIVQGNVPAYFKNKTIIEINMGTLVAGTTFRGDFEIRLKNIMEEFANNPDIILFIDEIHTIMSAGETSGGNLNVANMLKPALAKGEMRCIGATTTDEYLQFFQKDSALDRRFYKIHIEELGAESTFSILQSLYEKNQEHFKVTIEEEQLRLIIELADTELKNKVFPDKAIDILEKTLSRTALKNMEMVTNEIIKSVVAEYAGYQICVTEDEKTTHLLGLEGYLLQRCLGQEAAIHQIARSVMVAKQKIKFNATRPDGVFLLTGPSGVGKTYIAREIAQYLYGSVKKCVTLNMSEYSESHSGAKLLGSPPGYVGHENVSVLNKLIETNPSCVLLLDNVDQAHEEVLKIFLQIFEEGRIDDTSGKTIYFSNCTIIMTSNIIMEKGLIGFEQSSHTMNLMKRTN